MKIQCIGFYRKISILAIFCMIFTMMPSSAFAANKEASDISNHWAKGQIQSWIDKGLIKGYKDGSFKPDNNISRAEFMTLVNGALGYKEMATASYSDVPSDAWYANTIAVAKGAGYISGYPDNTMKPDSPISRGEAASILMKIKKLEVNGDSVNQFSDASKLGWSKDAVGAVCAANIMNGYPDGSFGSQNPIKRGEAVVALDKALAYSSKDITYSKAGTYGPATGVLEIDGNVTITEKGTKLQNIVIKGNLTIGKNVGEGEVTLDKVTVKGETKIYGGGPNSIIVIDSTLGKVTVSKEGGKIRIMISGSTTVKEVTANSGVKLEEGNLTGASTGFQEVIIDADKDDSIVLLGTFSQVDVKSAGLKIEVPKGTIVDTLVLNEKTAVTGTGTVKSAEIKASGMTFETAPKATNVTKGVTAPTIGSTASATGGSSSGGGSGNGGGSNNPIIEVSTISVIGNGNANTITTNNGTLQMTALVLPTTATNKNITWLVTNTDGSATDKATISNDGLLRASKNGDVIVKATSVSNKTVYATMGVTISNQFVPVTLNSIAVKTPATKLTYWVGESLDITGLVIEGTYSNASKKDEHITDANVTGFDSSAAVASQTLTVTFGGKTTTYAVEIKAVPVTLTSIAVKMPATKLIYTVGDTLDITGLVIEGTYSDRSKKQETITTANVAGFDSSVAVASQTLTVTFDGKTVTYAVEIKTANAANAASVATVKSLISGATYSMTQTASTDEAAVKTAIESIISGLALDGVSSQVTNVDYTPAIEGTKVDINGTNGMYTFTVALSKGADATLATDTTNTLTMTIIAKVFVPTAASVSNVTATNGTVTITLQAKPTEAVVANDFRGKIAINGATANPLTLEGFNYDGNVTITYTFTPVVQTASAQSVVVTVTHAGKDNAADAFTVVLTAQQIAINAINEAVGNSTKSQNISLETINIASAQNYAIAANLNTYRSDIESGIYHSGGYTADTIWRLVDAANRHVAVNALRAQGNAGISCVDPTAPSSITFRKIAALTDGTGITFDVDYQYKSDINVTPRYDKGNFVIDRNSGGSIVIEVTVWGTRREGIMVHYLATVPAGTAAVTWVLQNM